MCIRDRNHDWKKEAKSGAKSIYLSMRKAVDIPALVADLLDGYMKGQTRINLDPVSYTHLTTEAIRLLRSWKSTVPFVST